MSANIFMSLFYCTGPKLTEVRFLSIELAIHETQPHVCEQR